jgi:RNA polymerase sigma factor (sigma-70 family)
MEDSHETQDDIDRSGARSDVGASTTSAEHDHKDKDARDRRLLRRIAAGRGRGDEIGRLRETTATGELLACYWSEVCRVVRWRLASISPDPADIDDVTSSVMEHMIGRLKTTTDFGGTPFRVVVYLDAQSRAIDYWRARSRRNRRVSDFGGELPEVAVRESVPVALVHAEVMAEIIEDLGPREQRILLERYVVGLAPQEIADRLDVSRKVIDTASSRALAKLRANPRVTAVRNRMEEAV